MSETVHKVMASYGPPGSDETAVFIGKVDRFFDCLNGITLHDKKPDRTAYHSVNDERFTVLLILFSSKLFLCA